MAQLGSAGALGALGRRFESCRPDQSETGFPACLFLMGNNSVGKTWAKELSVLVEKLDVATDRAMLK